MKENFKAMVVGAGFVSGGHVDGYKNKGVEVVAVVEPNEEARRKFMERHGIEHGFATIEEALALKPDIASLCTPNWLHCAQAITLLEAGVHVVTEKPMARSVAECDKMIETAQRTGKRLFVAHNQRFFPSHQHMIRTVREGKLGRPLMVISTIIGNEYPRMNDPKNWKGDYEHSGGGVLIDNGAHMINLLLGALGPVEYVEACGDRLLVDAENKAEDNMVVSMKFKNGALGSLTATFTAQASAYPKTYRGIGLRTEIIGEKASLYAGNGNPAFAVVENGGLNRIEYENIPDVPVVISNMLGHFIDCIETGEEPFVTMYDGRDTLKVIEAAYQSAREGKRVYLG